VKIDLAELTVRGGFIGADVTRATHAAAQVVVAQAAGEALPLP
jgi:hypothetical protein